MCNFKVTNCVLLTLIMYPNFITIEARNFESLKNESTKLIAVAVIYRHGDRSPIHSFPNDKYYDLSYWPMGYGQLTERGIRRQFELGQWFRRRYKNFLSDIYSRNEIYIHSTDMDRTLMSAAANLAGLYPPKDFQLWNNQLPWQPIPIHTEDRAEDDIITEKRECRKFKELLEKLEKQTYPHIEKKYSELFEYISKQTGWTPLSITQVKSLYSVFNAYKSYNASFLPNWAYNLDPITLEFLAATYYELPSHTPEMARLRIGPFFNYLFNYFDTFVTPSSVTRPKFLMISAHDATLSAVLGAMRAFETRTVKFGDTVIWELMQRRDGTFFVNVLYKTEKGLYGLKVLNCDFDCNYYTFKENLEDVTVGLDQWMAECNSV